MSKVWLIRVPEQPGNEAIWEWLAADSAGSSVARGSLAQCASALATGTGARRQPVIALLPAARLLVSPVNAPARQQRQLQKALPFLLEENIASDIERLHVVAGLRLDSTRLQVLAIEREWLAALLGLMQQAGIDPDIVTSEALALPLPARGITGMTMLLDGEHSLLSSSEGHALGFDERDAALVADTLRLDAASEVRILLGTEGSSVTASSVESALTAREAAPQVAIDTQTHHRLAFAAQACAAAPARLPANLRQGIFAPAGSNSFLAPGFDWHPLAWLAASWAVLALGYQLAVGISYARAADDVRAAQVALYRQVFPGSSNVPSPRRQMEGQINSNAGGGTSFVSLVAQTSEALVALDAGSGRFTPRNLGWDGAHGQLRVDIVARSLDDLEQLRQALQTRGLLVDIGAGVAQDGGYKARMNVGMNPGGQAMPDKTTGSGRGS